MLGGVQQPAVRGGDTHFLGVNIPSVVGFWLPVYIIHRLADTQHRCFSTQARERLVHRHLENVSREKKKKRERESERSKGEKGGKIKERWKERKGERRERWIDKDRKEIKVERKGGRKGERKVERKGERKERWINRQRKGGNKGRVKGKRKGIKSERNKLSSQLQHPRESQAQPLLDNHRHTHTKHQILTQPGSPGQQSKASVTDTASQPHTTQSHTSHWHSPSPTLGRTVTPRMTHGMQCFSCQTSTCCITVTPITHTCRLTMTNTHSQFFPATSHPGVRTRLSL